MTMALVSNTYKLAATATTGSITLSDSDTNCNSVVIYNEGTEDAFVTSGVGATSAVMPGSNASPGKRIAGGATVTFQKNPRHNTIAAICDSGQTATLWIAVGTGE